MKESFKLSKSNLLFSLVIVILLTTRFLLYGKFDGLDIGYFVGTIIGIFIFPFLISLIVWLISKKNNSYGSLAFNIVLTIVLLSQFMRFINRITENIN